MYRFNVYKANYGGRIVTTLLAQRRYCSNYVIGKEIRKSNSHEASFENDRVENNNLYVTQQRRLRGH
jgi:hypothetical protein